jgi:hypothetical protein
MTNTTYINDLLLSDNLPEEPDFVQNTPDDIYQIVSLEIKKSGNELPSYTSDHIVYFDKYIRNIISSLRIFTIGSIYLIATDLINRDDSVQKIIDLTNESLSYLFIWRYIECCCNINKSFITYVELSVLKSFFQNSNISVRHVLSNYTYPCIVRNMLSIEIVEIIKPFLQVDDSNPDIRKILNKIILLDAIDVQNELFRPIETIYAKCPDDIENPIAVIVPTFQNGKYYLECLESVINQSYKNYRIITAIDYDKTKSCDCSDLTICYDIKKRPDINNRLQLLKQYTRQRQGAGRFICYKSTYDDEILVMLDGDDRLYNNNVLNYLNCVYQNRNIASTYGGYVDFFNQKIHTKLKGCEEFPQNILQQRAFRSYRFISSHLRTGYSALFKRIHLLDLIHNDGSFYHILTDFAETIPVLEMITPNIVDDHDISSNSVHFKCIKKPLVLYNLDNSLKYQTSYARRDELFNEFYHLYRIEAGENLQSKDIYQCILSDKIDTIKSGHMMKVSCKNRNGITDIDNEIISLLPNIVHQYGLDFLIYLPQSIVHLSNENLSNENLSNENLSNIYNQKILRMFSDLHIVYLSGDIDRPSNFKGISIVICGVVCTDSNRYINGINYSEHKYPIIMNKQLGNSNIIQPSLGCQSAMVGCVFVT